jgi:hypothetical protein
VIRDCAPAAFTIIAAFVAFCVIFTACAPIAPIGRPVVNMVQLPSGVYYVDPEPGVRCYARYSDTFSCVKQ